jgi:hypothetical protein
VIAADRQWHGYDEHGDFVTGTTTKLVVHPRLPLAMGSAGFLRLPHANEAVLVSTLLEQIVTDITQSSELNTNAVLRRVADRLHPLVRLALADPSLPPEPDKNRTTVLVGMVTRGRGELGVVHIGPEGVTSSTRNGYISAPYSLRDHLSTGIYNTEEKLYAASSTNPDRIAGHFRDLIDGSIAEEARLFDGVNREVGGGVDVVIVRPTVARLV